MKLDVRIMAVKSRQKYVERLLDQMGVSENCVMYDDRGPDGGGGCWYNAKRIWMLPMGDATHRMIVTDDTIVCNDFLSICNKLIETMPGAVFAFACGAWLKPDMRKGNSPYIRLKGCAISGQAIILPKPYIHNMLSWSDEMFGEDYKHDDGRVGWYCAYHDIPVYSVIPSLVDHDMEPDTVIPHHNRKDRYCRPWIGRDIGEQDWSDTNASVSPLRMCNMWLNKNDPHIPQVNAMMAIAREKARAITC